MSFIFTDRLASDQHNLDKRSGYLMARIFPITNIIDVHDRSGRTDDFTPAKLYLPPFILTKHVSESGFCQRDVQRTDFLHVCIQSKSSVPIL